MVDEDEAQSQTRAATLDDLRTLIRALNERNAPYLLIGGYALAAHGYVRATTDIDILVLGEPSAAANVISALMILPDQAAKDIDPAWFSEGENIRVNDAITIDVMFNAAGQTYETLLPYAEVVMLGDLPVHTVNLQGLLLTKQTVREKDQIDRRVLERAIEIADGGAITPERPRSSHPPPRRKDHGNAR